MTELTVFYNGACPICRTEIHHYQRISQRHDIAIAYRDISASDSCPLDHQAMLARLHVADDAGMHVGADAFLCLWAKLPRYRCLARVMRLPPARFAFAKIYDHALAPALYAWHRRRTGR